MVLKMFDHCGNELNVLRCVIKFMSAFKFYQTQSNKVPKQENVWSSNKFNLV